MSHIPVLLQTVCEYLELKSGDRVIDATAGEGGYSRAIMNMVGPGGKVLMIDWDEQAITRLRESFKMEIGSGLCVFKKGNFKNLKTIAEGAGWHEVSGIVFDFGTSRLTIKDFGKGFSFNQDEPLEMTYSSEVEEDAGVVVNRYPEQDLKRIFSEFGEERYSGRIARTIVEYRARKQVRTSKELADIVVSAVPRGRQSRIHPATQVFQALRIYVNKELDNISAAFPQAMELLSPGGRMVAVSYHSLEDRIVKNMFRDFGKAGIGDIITKKPVVPEQREIADNPSSRSAKLRCIEKI